MAVMEERRVTVRMRESIAGGTWAKRPGDEYECGEAEAERLIKAGMAVPAGESVRTATASAPVTRNERSGR